MLRKPILPLLLAASSLFLHGCDNDKSSSSVSIDSGSSGTSATTFTVCVDNSNVTGACDPSLATTAASVQFDRALKSFLFNPAYAAAVTGLTDFFVFYVDANGAILSTPAAAAATVSTTGLADGFYQITVTGDPTENIADSAFPVIAVDFNGTLDLATIQATASLAALNTAQNGTTFTTPFVLLSDLSDADGDGVTLDQISSDTSIAIIANNLLGTQTAATLETFIEDVAAEAWGQRATNPDFDLTQIVLDNEPDPDPTVQVYEDMIVSGTVSGASAQAAASSAEAGVAIDEAAVTILGLDQDGNEIFTAVTQTDENGFFNVNLPTIENSTESVLTRIEVTISKDGYVVGEKVFTDGFESGASLSLRALLGQETVVTQSRDQLAITASGERTFRLGLVKYSSGEVAAVAGQQFADARASADSDTLLDMAIPEDCVPAETTAVTARVAYFDPNDQTDVQSFPGSFQGTGDDTAGGDGINLDAGANDETYRLVSSVFSQVKLENQDGDNLSIDSSCGTSGDAATAAEGDAAVMTLSVPTDSYDTITEDTDADTEGVQVPIYIYSNGWKFAGNGTLAVLSDTAGVDYELYTGAVPPSTTDTPDLFVQITVTEGNEWIKWINLDWPIRPEIDAQTLCLAGTIEFDGADSSDLEPYNGSLEIESNTGWEWAYIDQGNLDFTTLLSGNADPETFTYQVWNWRTASYETLTPTSVVPDDDEDCDIKLSFEATLENPLQCKVSGTITKADGNPASFFWFEFNASNQFFNWGSSKQNGSYSFGAPCDQNGTIYVAGQEFTVNSADFEDDVQTIDIQLENAAPEVWAWAPWRIVNGDTVDVDVFAWDFDGTIASITATTCEGGTCTAPTTAGQPFSYTADTEGEHTLSFTATDDQGATGSSSITIVVDPVGNKPPRFNNFRVDGAFGGLLDGIIVGRGGFIDVRSGDTVSIRAQAFDPDADPLTYQWTGCDTDTTTNTCVVTTTSSGELAISVTITDTPTTGDPVSKSASMTLNVLDDLPPVIGTIFSKPAAAIDGGNGNVKNLQFKAFVDDDFTAPQNLTFEWNLEASDGSGTPITGTDPELSVASGTLVAGEYDVTVTVTDGNANESSRTRSYLVKEHKAPVIQVPASKNVLANENGTNAEAVTVIAVATDDLTPVAELTFEWEVTGANLTTPITQTGATLSIAAGTLAQGSYSAVVTVSDGPEGGDATKSSEATVTIGVFTTPSETTVIVQ
ncbi:Ig-like domain-containing protein [Litoribrevibacter euphylliae]|uniref:Ig-like domain-containing protein n=1 Tax=Litoribrevibacter euphylliae TaxID=1834034 RepID=A0ABV7HKQ2_9GAMM